MLTSIAAASLGMAAKIITSVDTRWIARPASTGPRVYIANHSSHADFVLLWACLPRHLRACTCPVAAADYWTRGGVRRFLIHRVFQGVLVDRGHIQQSCNPLAEMLLALDAGKSLVVFPEGTRGTGVRLGQFKCGIYHLARARPELEFVPVWIDNLNRVLPKGALLPVPLRCSVTFGAPARLGDGESKDRFLARMRRRVAELGESCHSTTKHYL